MRCGEGFPAAKHATGKTTKPHAFLVRVTAGEPSGWYEEVAVTPTVGDAGTTGFSRCAGSGLTRSGHVLGDMGRNAWIGAAGWGILAPIGP